MCVSHQYGIRLHIRVLAYRARALLCSVPLRKAGVAKQLLDSFPQLSVNPTRFDFTDQQQEHKRRAASAQLLDGMRVDVMKARLFLLAVARNQHRLLSLEGLQRTAMTRITHAAC